MRASLRIQILLVAILMAGSSFAQLEKFEDIEAVGKEGFFKSHFQGLFSGFKDFGEPFNLTGGLGLNMRSYSSFGTDARQDPFFYSLNANVNIRVYKLSLPFSLMVSAKNTTSSYPNIKELINAFKNNVKNKIENQKNRFVRFGASPRYKWIKLHFGHRSMNFSPFTLANLNFLGAGMELNPGNIRFGAMYGRLAKAEPIDLSLVTPNIPVYERKGWGLKMGYGTSEEFIDLILFKAVDEVGSITIPEDNPNQVDPAENLVIGLNFQKSLFEKFRLKMEYATSAHSPNSLEGMADNRFPHPRFLIQGRTTTEYKSALDTKLDFQAKVFTVGVQYKRIDPDYQSFGAYFFNNDIEDYLANLSFGLLQGAVTVNMSAGLQKNNLDKTLPTTMTRYIGSGNINYSAGSFNLGFNYSNNSSDIAYLLDESLDSLNVLIVTQDAGLNATYNFQDQSQNQHVLTGTFNIQAVTDDVANEMESSASQMLVGNLVYNYALAESQWKFSVKANYNQNELSQMTMRRYGAGFGITKSFLEGKLNTGIDLNYFLMTSENTGDNNNLNSQVRFNFKINDAMSLNMNWGLLSSKKVIAGTTDSFSELTGTLGFQYNFSKKRKEPAEGGGD